MESQLPNGSGRPSRWKRKGFWIFVIINVAGLLLIIPLLKAVGPLLGIWWNTRSQDSITRHVAASARAPRAVVNNEKPAEIEAAPDPVFSDLTNKLNVLQGLSDSEIQKIVAQKFGAKKPQSEKPAVFDRDSAVFHKITRKTTNLQGKDYYCYEIDLVDQNGNHSTQADCFNKPDVDYERSMATLDLIEKNPQLKSIYSAFAHVLGEKSSDPKNTGPSTGPGPSLRFEGKLPESAEKKE
jgi:hypothetical protein